MTGVIKNNAPEGWKKLSLEDAIGRLCQMLVTLEKSGTTPSVTVTLGEYSADLGAISLSKEELPCLPRPVSRAIPDGQMYTWMENSEDGVKVRQTIHMAPNFRIRRMKDTQETIEQIDLRPCTPKAERDGFWLPPIALLGEDYQIARWPNEHEPESDPIKKGDFEECEKRWDLSLRMLLYFVVWRAEPLPREQFLGRAPEDIKAWLQKPHLMRVTYNNGDYHESLMDMNVGKGHPKVLSLTWGRNGIEKEKWVRKENSIRGRFSTSLEEERFELGKWSIIYVSRLCERMTVPMIELADRDPRKLPSESIKSFYIAGTDDAVIRQLAGLGPAVVSSLLGGIPLRLGGFEPGNAAYQSDGAGLLSANAKWNFVPNPLTGPGVFIESLDLAFVTTTSPKYTFEGLKRLINLPILLSGPGALFGQCIRNTYFFGNATAQPQFRTGNATLGPGASGYNALPGQTSVLQRASPDGVGNFIAVDGLSACAQTVGYNPEDCEQAAGNVDPAAL